MKMTPFADRELTQVFVSEVSVTVEDDLSLALSGNVEIHVRAADGSADGPGVTVGVTVTVERGTPVEDLPKLLLARALELIKRVSTESIETLVTAEAHPFDSKWKRAEETGE